MKTSDVCIVIILNLHIRHILLKFAVSNNIISEIQIEEIMQKIFNMVLATAMMLLIISCSKDDSKPIEPEKKPTISMVLIPAGTFQIGNTGAYSGLDSENPEHTVTISKAFYMSKYEVTQKQYQAVMDTNPSYFIGENLPVEQVTWYNAVEFCNALSQLEGKTPCYTIQNDTNVTCNWDANGYRLPTEAEWEYACKAGSSADFYSGSLTNSGFSPLDPNLGEIGWYSGNSGSKTKPVGRKQPNAFGLYDMSGNVGEWCWDWFSGYTNATDPKGPTSGSFRVHRGGSWSTSARLCSSAYRSGNFPSISYNNGGFRIARAGN